MLKQISTKAQVMASFPSTACWTNVLTMRRC